MTGALHSDHVNYLIFRYLQENGHKNAAEALHRDWHRKPEFKEPENYPFAPVVKTRELVSLIQDGLQYDKLVAQRNASPRRFRFTNSNAHDASESREGLENGVMGSRPGSSAAKRKSRPAPMRQPDEFPTPAPKRQRRSEGSEGANLNGDRDAMDVDAASASLDADGDEDAEARSPTIASEPEVFEVPERYDSHDVWTQTDFKTGPKTSTMTWKIDKPGVSILHSIWNPDSDPKNAKTLLTVGESLCRFYQIPDQMDETPNVSYAAMLRWLPVAMNEATKMRRISYTSQVLSIDEPHLPLNSLVTATAWHPKGHSAVFATTPTDPEEQTQQMLICHNRDSGKAWQYEILHLREPAGIFLALRYSSNGDYLLVARSDEQSGRVLVYDTTLKESRTRPIAWWTFESSVLDVAWCGEQFVVCGDNHLLETFELSTEAVSDPTKLTPESASSHGLEHIEPWGRKTLRTMEKVRFDERSRTVVLASPNERQLIVGKFDYTPTRCLVLKQEKELPGQLSALAFQPAPEREPSGPGVLAATFYEGSCILYSFNRADKEKSLKDALTLELSEGPALALAWSRDGAFLAVGGTDVVQIWKFESLFTREGEALKRVSGEPDPFVTWRPGATANGLRNGEHVDDNAPLPEPSLSWSVDRESLAFAVDKQVAIIRFRPPLGSSADASSTVLNGHTTS